MKRRRLCRLAAGLVALASLAPASSAAQAAPLRVSYGLQPDTVTVGGRFVAAVQVQAPPGHALEFPVFPELEQVQATGPTRFAPGGDPATRTAYYPLVAWRTGVLQPVPLEIRLIAPDGSVRSVTTALRMPVVLSVLPADTVGLEPRGAKGILAQPRAFPWWLAALLLLAGLATWLALRRWLGRRREPAVLAALPPRDRALAELERARKARLIEAREWKLFFSLVSGALRQYLAAVGPSWGADLTTTELLDRLHEDGADDGVAATLEDMLRTADLVKFARYRPDAAEAEAALAAAREVIERLEPEAHEVRELERVA